MMNRLKQFWRPERAAEQPKQRRIIGIDVKLIPHKDHQFTTIGHWTGPEVDGIVRIYISREICWQNIVAVLFHELIEFFMCYSKGITTAECDAFDELFEQEYDAGIWPKSVEAGFDPRCPYRKGHLWGTRFERLVIWLIGGDWKACNKECDQLMLGGE
jgi:hypothetical protein